MSGTAPPTGRDAAKPTEIPPQGWWQVLKRTYIESGKDHLDLISAGVAFYGFLAMVPLLGALVLTYGLIVDPSELSQHMAGLTKLVPGDAAALINEQLKNVVATATGKKGLGLAFALLLAVYGAMKGAGAVVTALNITYEEPETRGVIKTTLINAAVTLTAIILAVALILAGSVTAALDEFVHGFGDFAELLLKAASWLVVAAIASLATAALYRFAPSRSKAQWKWITPGSILATLGLVLTTLGFGFYAANFGNYNATYGSLGAVVVLLMWLYLSAYVLLLGAEFNAELEHQTAHDTTSGRERPLGSRGAKMADEVAASANEKAAPGAMAVRPVAPVWQGGLIQTLATITAIIAVARVFLQDRAVEARRP